MIKTSRQLKDLINNLARKNAADAQLLMRNYMMERFLERVSLSQRRCSMGCVPHLRLTFPPAMQSRQERFATVFI